MIHREDRGRRSLRPALSRGDGEEGEESPADVVIVKLVSPPLPPLHLLLVSGVVNVEASEGHKSRIALFLKAELFIVNFTARGDSLAFLL